MTIANHIFDIIFPEGDKGGPSMDAMLARFDKELENFNTLVPPAPESKPRTPFDNPDQPADVSKKFANMTPRQALSMIPDVQKMYP